jgi:PAS domain S-box-containing protein
LSSEIAFPVVPQFDEAGIRALIERASNVIALVDGDATFRYVSPAVSRMLGYSPPELIGRDSMLLAPPEDRDEAIAAFRAVTQRPGETIVHEHRSLRKDGSLCWLETTSTNLLDDPRVGAIVSNFRDISERKMAERERAQRERHAELNAAIGMALTSRNSLAEQLQHCAEALVAHFDAGLVRIWELDADVLVLRAGAGLETTLEGMYSRIPVGALKIGRVAAERRPELTNAMFEDPDVPAQAWSRRTGMVAFAGYPLLVGERLVGAIAVFAAHPLETSALTVLGSTADMIAVGIDRAMSEAARESLLQRELAARLRAEIAEAHYRGLFEGVADAILVADTERQYQDANTAATDLLGYTRDELLALRVDDVVVNGPAETGVDLARAQEQGRWQGEFELRRKDGTTVPVEARATVVALPDGPVSLSVMRDVSGRRAFDQMQSEFLSAVSHDLKNPLTAIHGQAQLLRRRAQRNALTDQAALVHDLDVILTSSAGLASQLEELQDVARLRSGQSLELSFQITDLVTLTRETVASAQATTGHHRIRFHAADADLAGRYDAVRIRRVLDNLLANAIKYSPRGGSIDVLLHREDPPDADVALATLVVRDEGVGIPAADLGHVFERFHRGSNVAGRIAGTGIGLSGARQIVEQHGGSITVESEENHGSTFTVTLPLPGRGRSARWRDA